MMLPLVDKARRKDRVERKRPRSAYKGEKLW